MYPLVPPGSYEFSAAICELKCYNDGAADLKDTKVNGFVIHS